MATQFDPIAKDESLNTTESPSRNVADVLAQGLDAIEQAIAGGSGSGGHTIVNASGTDMTQRAKMQFVDAGVTDDSANDKTKVEIVQTISAESDLTSAPDGVYQGTWDESVSDVLTADMVGYGSGTVEDALDKVMTAESVTLTKQSSAIDATTLSAKSKAGNLHFFGYFRITALLSAGTTLYTFATHRPSEAQSILAINTNGSTASVTVYGDGRVYAATEMGTGYWVLVGEVWE